MFGVSDTAQLAKFYLTHDSEHTVEAFTVNADYMPDEPVFEGLPVVPFEEITDHYPPAYYSLFIPMTALQMNQVRAKLYQKGKALGYSFISYVSSKATIFENQIGENCFILEDNTLQPFTSIGNNVVLWSGNHIGHHGIIDDHVLFTSHVVLSGHCHVKPFSFFGVNATIRDGTTIETGTFVAMGTSITKNTEAWGVYMGNPAKKRDRLKSTDMC